METDKDHIPASQFVESAAYLLRETFEGSPDGQASAFLDRGIGVLNTLDALSAEQASTEVEGMTITAQAEHAKFYVDRLCEFINGRTERVNWDDSWLIETVDDNEWTSLRDSIRDSYAGVLKCLAAVDHWDPTKMGMAFGLVAHTAYHLGAIRQIAKSVNK